MSFAYKISAYNRKRKWKKFLNIVTVDKETKILDVGYTNKEYSKTDNLLEKKYPHKNKITALGVEDNDIFSKKYPEVKVVKYDGKKIPFEDKSFDVCWSNAVIEHVGNIKKQKFFIKELSRVAETLFFTTPNKYFPIEVHTRVPLLHFLLPKKYFDKFLCLIRKKWATEDYMNLLSLKDIKRLLEEADIIEYEIIKNRIMFFTIDFVIIVKR